MNYGTIVVLITLKEKVYFFSLTTIMSTTKKTFFLPTFTKKCPSHAHFHKM